VATRGELRRRRRLIRNFEDFCLQFRIPAPVNSAYFRLDRRTQNFGPAAEFTYDPVTYPNFPFRFIAWYVQSRPRRQYGFPILENNVRYSERQTRLNLDLNRLVSTHAYLSRAPAGTPINVTGVFFLYRDPIRIITRAELPRVEYLPSESLYFVPFPLIESTSGTDNIPWYLIHDPTQTSAVHDPPTSEQSLVRFRRNDVPGISYPERNVSRLPVF
jgi:hypothetical protein